MTQKKRIVIIGAGAAGLMAAANINCGALVLERNEKAGKKIYITGKGRCNLTNNVAPADFLKRVVRGEKFARGMIHRFPPETVMDFFEEGGLSLKTERGNRVFPVSDKASDVTKTLLAAIEQKNGEILYNTYVKNVKRQGEIYKIFTESQDDKKVIDADILVVATGGKSYPLTGSDGGFFNILRALGQDISPLYPSLVPFVFKEDTTALRGISFKNVGLEAFFADNGNNDLDAGGRTVNKKGRADEFKAEGEILFTGTGISGPAVLTLSSLCAGRESLGVKLDFFTGKTRDQLDKKLIGLFAENQNSLLKNILARLLPKSLTSYIIESIGIEDKPCHSVSRAERELIAECLKGLAFSVLKTGGFDEAVTTCGGVDLKQVDPKTMESRINKNLFIIGEALDMDALTGGFNLQLCFSSAFAAAEAINETVQQNEIAE